MCGPRPSLCAGTLPPSSLAALQLRRSLRSYPHRFSCPETDHFSVIIIRPPPRIRLRAHPVLLSPSPILAPHLASHLRASVKLPQHLPDCACPHGIASAFVGADCFPNGSLCTCFQTSRTTQDRPTVPDGSLPVSVPFTPLLFSPSIHHTVISFSPLQVARIHSPSFLTHFLPPPRPTSRRVATRGIRAVGLAGLRLGKESPSGSS